MSLLLTLTGWIVLGIGWLLIWYVSYTFRAIVGWVFIFWMFLYFSRETVLIYLLYCINPPNISSLTQIHEWLQSLDAQWLRCPCLAAWHIWLFLSCQEFGGCWTLTTALEVTRQLQAPQVCENLLARYCRCFCKSWTASTYTCFVNTEVKTKPKPNQSQQNLRFVAG